MLTLQRLLKIRKVCSRERAPLSSKRTLSLQVGTDRKCASFQFRNHRSKAGKKISNIYGNLTEVTKAASCLFLLSNLRQISFKKPNICHRRIMSKRTMQNNLFLQNKSSEVKYISDYECDAIAKCTRSKGSTHSVKKGRTPFFGGTGSVKRIQETIYKFSVTLFKHSNSLARMFLHGRTYIVHSNKYATGILVVAVAPLENIKNNI